MRCRSSGFRENERITERRSQNPEALFEGDPSFARGFGETNRARRGLRVGGVRKGRNPDASSGTIRPEKGSPSGLPRRAPAGRRSRGRAGGRAARTGGAAPGPPAESAAPPVRTARRPPRGPGRGGEPSSGRIVSRETFVLLPQDVSRETSGLRPCPSNPEAPFERGSSPQTPLQTTDRPRRGLRYFQKFH